MPKIDFKKTLKELYSPKNSDWQLINVPPMQYLMIDGAGNPNTSPVYAGAIEALYSLAYPLKFMSKSAGKDYVIPPLEGLWYADDMSVFQKADKDSYKWTMMLMQPDWITPAMLKQAKLVASQKRPSAPYDQVRLKTYSEGQAFQCLHVGSYDDEAPKLAALHQEVIPSSGVAESLDHHEIYLSDPRKTAPAKLRTILRQPVKPVK